MIEVKIFKIVQEETGFLIRYEARTSDGVVVDKALRFIPLKRRVLAAGYNLLPKKQGFKK